jgi:predicted dehydrogenase
MREKEKDLQAISVCTWASTLARNAALAISAGKNVLIEKPMALNVQEAEKLALLAEEKQVTLSVGFLTRFIPELRSVKRIIMDGTIGELVQVNSRRDS